MNQIQLKKSAIIFAISCLLFTLGLFLGVQYEKRVSLENVLNESILQLAENLESIRYVREGRTDSLIALLNANSDARLAYLMRYEDFVTDDSEFVRRKTKVLNSLRREWFNNPRTSGNSLELDSEWKNFQKEKRTYLEKYSDQLEKK